MCRRRGVREPGSNVVGQVQRHGHRFLVDEQEARRFAANE
jgi:hypothetical protein